MSISLRLREERKRLGLTQDAFGTAGGVLKGAVINYEKGERAPDVTFLAGIATAGADVLYIVTGERAPVGQASLPAEAAAVLASYEDASPAGRAAFHAVALLAAERSNAAGTTSKAAVNLKIGGDVGQAIAGDQTNTGSVSFAVGKRSK